MLCPCPYLCQQMNFPSLFRASRCLPSCALAAIVGHCQKSCEIRQRMILTLNIASSCEHFTELTKVGMNIAYSYKHFKHYMCEHFVTVQILSAKIP